ncbi:helix-turn-helix domain-containing protein, partial [Pseudomonas capeferrum]|uniref:helix-turn-helix domain-containing protein n=1 Tax=Pseudomonas capeferrum TaxID=1495066 RepID=UPI0015E308EE
MLHTIQEAMKLAGVSRRTLYNHSDAGRISYSIGPDGRRRFETAELERVYGKLQQVAQPATHQSAQLGTPVLSTNDLGKVIEEAVQRATIRLATEIAELRAMLLRIEHQPDTPAATALAKASPDAPVSSDQESVVTGSPQHSHSPR